MINEIVTVRKPLIHCDYCMNPNHATFRGMITVPIFNTIMGVAALCRKAFSDVNTSQFSKRLYNRYMKEQSWGMLIAISIPILGCIPGIMLCRRHERAFRKEYLHFIVHGVFSDTITSSFSKIKIIQRVCLLGGKAEWKKIPAEMFSWHEYGIKISVNDDTSPDLLISKHTPRYTDAFQRITSESVLRIVQSMVIAVEEAADFKKIEAIQHELREIIKLCPKEALNSREIAVAMMSIDPKSLKYCYDKAVQGILDNPSANDLDGINVKDALIAIRDAPKKEVCCSDPVFEAVKDAINRLSIKDAVVRASELLP
jgi:hypothetical protein